MATNKDKLQAFESMVFACVHVAEVLVDEDLSAVEEHKMLKEMLCIFINLIESIPDMQEEYDQIEKNLRFKHLKMTNTEIH